MPRIVIKRKGGAAGKVDCGVDCESTAYRILFGFYGGILFWGMVGGVSFLYVLVYSMAWFVSVFFFF